jgi:hypothetical protein
MATDFEGLIPVGVSGELVASVEIQSAAMRLGSVSAMPTGVESVPVVAVEPDAEWTNPRIGGRKLATKIEWSALRLEAEELACTLAIPTAWTTDTSFDVWGQVRERLASAFAKRIDETLLFAVAPVPASFPPTGVVGVAGAAVTGTDALAALLPVSLASHRTTCAIGESRSCTCGASPGRASERSSGSATSRSRRTRTATFSSTRPRSSTQSCSA